MMPAWILSFCSGFLSLSFELLWIRLASFMMLSVPQAFALVLTIYLLGIAYGAWVGKIYCDKPSNFWRISGIYLACAALVGLIGPWAVVATNKTAYFYQVMGLAVGLSSAFIAVVFPIAHHLGTITNSNTVGRSLSKVYVANILGATMGPIFSGIILLSLVTTQQAFLICSALTFMLASSCIWQGWRRYLSWVVLIAASIAVNHCCHSHALIEKASVFTGKISRIVENQYGVIVSYDRDEGGDIIVGGNVYDGRTNLDPVLNTNGIHRILILPLLQPKPKKVLLIGLSVGTWLALVETFPNVESIDAIEINPGYLELIKDYPEQEKALHDPRLHLYFDDARRWLRANPDNRYDLVIMNTTFHWRAYSSNLLSKDFLTIIKRHMLPNAVMAFNTTSSPDALKTAATVFPYAFRYDNFAIAADFDWRKNLNKPGAVTILGNLKLNGQRLFPEKSEPIIKKYIELPVLSVEELQATPEFKHRPFEVVTDRNLLTEYKYGRWSQDDMSNH